jgi:hypothetical protein
MNDSSSQFTSPELSVLISTFDDRDFVEKKLLEVEAQVAFERVEFIFIEPNSPGSERDLLEPFCEKHANCRLIKLDQRITLYQAWNLGWEAASAPLVCISNMDDAMHPELLERVIAGMARNAWDVATVLIAKQVIDEDMNSWEQQRLRQLELCTRPGPFFVWRTELKEFLGMFDERLELIGDKDFLARIDSTDLKVGLIPETLYLYTKHPAQLSKRVEFKTKKRAERVLCENKDYPHVWPSKLYWEIRWVRLLRKLPYLRRRFYLVHSSCV